MNLTSIINWQKGTPTEYGSYLVLHRDHLGRLVIDHDIWFDDCQRWQSQWHNMIAWCAFEDIIPKEEKI